MLLPLFLKRMTCRGSLLSALLATSVGVTVVCVFLSESSSLEGASAAGSVRKEVQLFEPSVRTDGGTADRRLLQVPTPSDTCPVRFDTMAIDNAATVCEGDSSQSVCCSAVCTTDFGAGPLSLYWAAKGTFYFNNEACHKLIQTNFSGNGYLPSSPNNPVNVCAPKCIAFNASAPLTATDVTSENAPCRVLFNKNVMQEVGDTCKADPSQPVCCKAVCTTDFGRGNLSSYAIGAKYGGQASCDTELTRSIYTAGGLPTATFSTCAGKCSLFNATAPAPPATFASSTSAPCLALFNSSAVAVVRETCIADVSQQACCPAVCTTDYGAGPLSRYWAATDNNYNNQVSCSSELGDLFATQVTYYSQCADKCRLFNATAAATPVPPSYALSASAPCLALFNATAVASAAEACQLDSSQAGCCPSMCTTDFGTGPLSAYWAARDRNYNNQAACQTELGSALVAKGGVYVSGLLSKCTPKCQIFNGSATVPPSYAVATDAPCLVLLNATAVAAVAAQCSADRTPGGCCPAVCNTDFGRGAFAQYPPGKYNNQASCNAEIINALYLADTETIYRQCPANCTAYANSTSPSPLPANLTTPSPTSPTTPPPSQSSSGSTLPGSTSPSTVTTGSSPPQGGTSGQGVESGGGSNLAAIGAVVAVGVVVVLLGLFCLYCLCQTRRKNAILKQDLYPTGGSEQYAHTESAQVPVAYPPTTPPERTYGPVKAFTYAQLQQFTDNFSQVNFLGHGAFGQVFKAVLPGGEVVAVKCLSGGPREAEASFVAEVESIGRVHHRTLVKLLGYCAEGGGAYRALVFEFVPNGNLHQHLHGSPFGVLAWPMRMKIAHQVACGLAYLHSECNPPIVHLDVKSANVLLDSDLSARVADFGLARAFNESSNPTTSRVPGTPGYCDPEAMQTLVMTDRSDVYSFGVLLLELVTGRKPIASRPENGLVAWAEALIRAGRCEEVVDQKLRGAWLRSDVAAVCSIALSCVRSPAAQRPTMKQVARSLERFGTEEPSSQGSLASSDGGSSLMGDYSVPTPLVYQGSTRQGSFQQTGDGNYSAVYPMAYQPSYANASSQCQSRGGQALHTYIQAESFHEPR